MGKIDYKAIYDKNKQDWLALTADPQKYEALLAGHYSDSNHFVYELLQNAEDAFETNGNGVFDPKTCVHANKVVIEYYNDKLVFYHNGKPFDEADVRGVSSMLMGTKNRDDAQTIGRFGMGFKSVFKYTYQPEIYSDEEAFMITRYLLPVEISDTWDFNVEKKTVSCKTGGGIIVYPFSMEKHLTKIVIPFKKYGKDETLIDVSGNEVLKKLDELNGEILLFLTHITELYWVNKETGKYAHISKRVDYKDQNLITCRIESTETGDKEEIMRFYRFKKVFHHKDMSNAEVSVAYKLNSRLDNVNDVESSPVWVYFPTRDITDLPFLIHGSFETAVSREKLMTPSAFNDDLLDALGTLIANSMEVLAQKKLITQMFIRRILMAAFRDEEDNGTIPGLKEKITNIFKQKGLLPDQKGIYRKPSSLKIPIPFRISDFSEKTLIGKVLDGKSFVSFNNAREIGFIDYYTWLSEDLKISTYKLSDMAKDLDLLSGYKIQTSSELLALKSFYDFLSDNRESVYETGLSFSRSGAYESAIRQDIALAWKRLRKAPIILNRADYLVSAYKDNKQAIYLGSTSEYKRLVQSALVSTEIGKTFERLLVDGFKISEFNNYQYVKEKVVQKYIEIDEEIGFLNQDDFVPEYIEDLNQIISLFDERANASDIREMLKEAYIIKIRSEQDEDSEDEIGVFETPQACYVPKSDEGIDLEVYFAPIKLGKTIGGIYDPNWKKDFGVYPIDVDFYEQNGIQISKLKQLGLITSPVIEGKRNNNGVGNGYWIALGEYCPEIDVIALDDNLEYIEENPEEEISKKKSAEIFRLLLSIFKKLQGKKKYRKNNPYTGELENSAILNNTILWYSWLYDENLDNLKSSELSCYDLNTRLYGSVLSDKAVYEVLGFAKKEKDDTEEAIQKAQQLNNHDKRMLINVLAKELGLHISDDNNDDDWDNPDDVFNPNEWTDEEFPIHRVVNMDYLVQHVQEQFYCADPTTYSKVLRQIRISKNSKADKAYAKGMYTNLSNVTICQICKRRAEFAEIDQIANFGIEMPQLNLCLCRNCSARFRVVRDTNKVAFRQQIRKTIMDLNTKSDSQEYAIEVCNGVTIHFTQTHISEIQVILGLLSEYGLPSSGNTKKETLSEQTPVPQEKGIIKKEHFSYTSTPDTSYPKDESDKQVAKDGSIVSYKRIDNKSNETMDMTLYPNKYPLHALMKGHKAGDVIRFKGKEFEIIKVENRS